MKNKNAASRIAKDDTISESILKVIQENTFESNREVSRILLITAGIALFFWGSTFIGLWDGMGRGLDTGLLLTCLASVAVSFWCLRRHGEGTAFRYILLSLFALLLLWMDVASGYKSRLLMALPMVVSTRYYSRKLLFAISGITTVYLLFTILINAFLYASSGLIDLNVVTVSGFFTADGLLRDSIIALHPDKWVLFRNGIVVSFLPNTLYLWGIALCCDRWIRYNLEHLIRINELARRDAEQATEIADMRTRIVLSQVRPHFVYNTLTSIASLCAFDAPKAKELTIDFATYLRANLDSLSEDSVPLCPFSDELDHVKCYLNIEQVRFEDRLKVEYDIATTDFMTPVLSVQPLVENAVKHGICKRAEGGTVKIATREASNGWILTVSDDGVGFDINSAEQDGKIHVGMANVRRRLELYGCTLTVESTPGVGTTSTIFLPREIKEP